MKRTHVLSTRKEGLRPIHLSMTRKSSRPKDLLIRRLREYLLYSNLRSLLPPQLPPLSSTEMAIEYEPPSHEIPARDFDEDIVAESRREEKEEEEEDVDDVVCDCRYVSENEKAIEPSIKIKRMDNCLLISTVVLKDVALSSSLFRLIEEEKLDLIFENQYRTETKVSHTLQVRLPLEYDVDGLERKLQTWARTGTHL